MSLGFVLSLLVSTPVVLTAGSGSATPSATSPETEMETVHLQGRVIVPLQVVPDGGGASALSGPHQVTVRSVGDVAGTVSMSWGAGETLSITAYCGPRAPTPARAQGVHLRQWRDLQPQGDAPVKDATKPARLKQVFMGRPRTGRRFTTRRGAGHVVATYRKGCTIVAAWESLEGSGEARRAELRQLVAHVVMAK